jgi:hypothetical protein
VRVAHCDRTQEEDSDRCPSNDGLRLLISHRQTQVSVMDVSDTGVHPGHFQLVTDIKNAWATHFKL